MLVFKKNPRPCAPLLGTGFVDSRFLPTFFVPSGPNQYFLQFLVHHVELLDNLLPRESVYSIRIQQKHPLERRNTLSHALKVLAFFLYTLTYVNFLFDNPCSFDKNQMIFEAEKGPWLGFDFSRLNNFQAIIGSSWGTRLRF